MSETFAVAFQHRSRFDPAYEDAGPWLFGIATMLLRRHRAGEARALRVFLASAAAFRESDDSMHAVSERLDAGLILARLWPVITALPSRDRDALFLYAWADLDYAGVAAALGVPVGTVRSRLNRVRRKLTVAATHADTESKTSGKGETDGCVGEDAQSAL